MSTHCGICHGQGHREKECDTPRFNEVSQRCRRHGTFRCSWCLRMWALDFDRDDLADALRAADDVRGERGGNGSIVRLATINTAWRAYEESTVEPNAGHPGGDRDA